MIVDHVTGGAYLIISSTKLQRSAHLDKHNEVKPNWFVRFEVYGTNLKCDKV